MYVSRLVLHQFRNYEQVDLSLAPGVTVFVGSNGQGKTNLVEAVDYLATLGSHRVASDLPLVRRGAEGAVVQAVVTRDGRTVTVEVQITPGKARKASINRTALSRASEVLGWVRSVVFSPEDLTLVKGEPAARRDFLDHLLVQRRPLLAGTMTDYERSLKQRNTLLKSLVANRRAAASEEALSTLAIWDEHLVKHGSELTAARIALLADLRPHVEAAYAVISGGASRQRAGLVYEPRFGPLASGPEAAETAAIAERLVRELAARQREELDRGLTLVGPHRDEVAFSLADGSDELPLRGYASHGESWSFALALKVGAHRLLRADGDDPVLILDDVFAELDASRRQALVELVGDAEQLLVTAAVADDVPVGLEGVRFRVAQGTVTAA